MSRTYTGQPWGRPTLGLVPVQWQFWWPRVNWNCFLFFTLSLIYLSCHFSSSVWGEPTCQLQSKSFVKTHLIHAKMGAHSWPLKLSWRSSTRLPARFRLPRSLQANNEPFLIEQITQKLAQVLWINYHTHHKTAVLRNHNLRSTLINPSKTSRSSSKNKNRLQINNVMAGIFKKGIVKQVDWLHFVINGVFFK